MAIKVGDTLPPDLKLKEMRDGSPKDVALGEIFEGKRVVLFAVPGAFTPTCSMKHLPGFVAEAVKGRGKVGGSIVAGAEEHAFVNEAGGECSGAAGKGPMPADGNRELQRVVGLE